MACGLSAKCQGTVLKNQSFIQLTPSQRRAHLGPLVPDDVELPAVGMATVEHRVVDELGHARLVAKETAALFRNITEDQKNKPGFRQLQLLSITNDTRELKLGIRGSCVKQNFKVTLKH